MHFDTLNEPPESIFRRPFFSCHVHNFTNTSRGYGHFDLSAINNIFVKIFLYEKALFFPLAIILSLCSACITNGSYVRLSDKEKAMVLSVRADSVFWGPESQFLYETPSDVAAALSLIDSAIALDPENKSYYYKKAGYLDVSGLADELSRVTRQLSEMEGNENYTLTANLGKCFARNGQTDSAKHYYRQTISLCRKCAENEVENAYIDSAYIAHLECYITGQRDHAIRKIKESADTSSMSEDDKRHFKQILDDFDLSQNVWQPSEEEIKQTGETAARIRATL